MNWLAAFLPSTVLSTSHLTSTPPVLVDRCPLSTQSPRHCRLDPSRHRAPQPRHRLAARPKNRSGPQAPRLKLCWRNFFEEKNGVTNVVIPKSVTHVMIMFISVHFVDVFFCYEFRSYLGAEWSHSQELQDCGEVFSFPQCHFRQCHLK